jgi:hypothetical protein
MTNDGIDEAQRAIAELMRTPVGRRWLLKAGLGTAAALAMPAWVTPATGQGTVADELGAAPRSRRGIVFHFALGRAAHLADLRVVASGREFALIPHTRSTRAALQSKGTLWRKIRRSQLTHFAEVPLRRDRGTLLSVHATRDGQAVLVAQAFHAPPAATRALAQAAFLLEGSYKSVAGSPERLAALGVDASQLTSVHEIADLETVVDPHQTAIALTMLHPNVATIAPTPVATTKALLGQTPEVGTLGTYIGQMQQGGQDYATLVPAVDANGNPSQIKVGSQTTTFSTVQLNQTDPTFTANARSAFVAGIQGIRDTGSLGKVINQPLDAIHDPQDTSTWHQPEGVILPPTPYQPPSGLQSGVTAQVKNPGLLYGTYTALNGPLSGRQVPLKLYNNYVRWVWVYVQYLKADGTNLSLDPGATFPNTKFSHSLGLLPQIFTLLGVPLWDTNTIEVTLDFPPEATSARLLFCGLGNDAVAGGWRQYFPANAYPDHIAPQDEVLFPALMTGIICIGLTSFALLTDLDIAATWGILRPQIFDLIAGFEDAFTLLIISGTGFLTAAESFAALVVAGGATYEDIANNHGDIHNIWNTLLSLGSIIPKIIFNPGAARAWSDVADVIIGEEASDKLLEALPLIGQVIAVIAAVGDAVTLAEAIGETATSPWVIENEISLTYQATVTVSKDSRAATWPLTAKSWRIEAKIDGAVALSPSTGALNGGPNDDDPIVLNLTAPFAGNTISWSIVVLDAAGHQVGTGVSAQLANNDAANPPSSVAFAITQLPAPITAATVFKRAATTTYSATGGSYIWANAVTDTGTRASSGIQEVSGVAIATRLGVAGIVWKQGDKYWLRGVPVREAGTTIALGGATKQGYTRRPFLLFDSFVGASDIANHVLLEPDETTPGYNLRRLAIDPTTGALSWDPTTSLGFFPLVVSAAALHSSGRIVAIHTDTGRLGHVLPANTPRPPLATYVAGPGTEIGLLSSPTAVAVSNPGIIIVLEAGASQLAAFDLNGNPVRYFGTGSPAAFTLTLPGPATYLDVAVDGSGQIYVLSFRGDGTQPADYRIDVYTPSGSPLATNSPGTNIPHLAVDYWRSIFGANYTALLDSGTGQPRIDPALGVAEPSLSRFDPITPSRARRRRR